MPRKCAPPFGKPHCTGMDGTTDISSRIASAGPRKGNACKDSTRTMDRTGRLAIVRRGVVRNASTATTRWWTPGNRFQQSGHHGYSCRTIAYTDRRPPGSGYKKFGKPGGRAEVFGGDISHRAVISF